jgi:integrase
VPFTGHGGSSPPSDTEKWAPDLRKRSQELFFWLCGPTKPNRTQTEVEAAGNRYLNDLRHTYVAWAVAAGGDLPYVQAQLCHESITTTWARRPVRCCR